MARGGALEFRVGSLRGRVVARLPVGNTGGWQRFARVTRPARPVPGVHDLYIVWRGTGVGGRLASLESYRFQ